MEAIADTYVGLDVHRKIVVATALDATGRELAQEKFGPEPSELIDFLAQLPGRKHVALEACSMWAPVLRHGGLDGRGGHSLQPLQDPSHRRGESQE